MALQLTPTWDRDGTVVLTLDRERGALTVRTPSQSSEYVLETSDPGRLGRWAARGDGEPDVGRRATVGEVRVACLREWDAEQGVLELTLQAADVAVRRGGPWAQAARRLRRQASAQHSERVSTVPLQTLWAQRNDQALTHTLAAERIGYRADGRADTSRLRRRLGLAGGEGAQRAVSYQTAVELCTALAVDPAEVGL